MRFLSIVAFALGCVGCSDHSHPAALEDHLASCDGVDAGCADGTPPRAAVSYECMSEERAAEFDNPLVSVIEAFENDEFFPYNTKPISGAARLMTLGELPFSFACLSTEAGHRFELRGGNSRSGDDGGLRIDPVGHDAFKPTLIQKVVRTDVEIPAIPVVATEDFDRIFASLGIRPRKNRGQIVVEVVQPMAGVAYRIPNVEIRCAAAEAIAYRTDGEWTTELDRTGGDGLALLINVPADEDLGALVDWSYINHAFADARVDELERVYAIQGGITYLSFFPEH